MYLDKPAFPINFPLERAVAEIESMVEGKYWHDFEVGELKLVYIPYWIFSYNAFAESAEEGKPKSVSEASSGKMALNARTNELEEEASYLYESAEGEMQNNPSSEYPFEIQRPNIVREGVARQLITLKLAAQLGVPKENIVISSLDLAYLPVWFAWVTVAEGTFHLQINAYNGEILNEQEVPVRERGWLELTSETFEELKQPGAWVDYSREIGQSVFGWFATNRQLQIAILAIIAVLVALWAMGFV